MEPEIKSLSPQKFVGKRIIMSFSENKTYELWRSFMPHRKEISNSIGTDVYSVEIYPPEFFDKFNPDKEFEKWAAVEVTDFNSVPEGMKTLESPGGLYAVFIHKGTASEGPKTYQYIFQSWLPASNYQPDNKTHFAVMGEKYKKDSPDSEEVLWIPVRPKG